MILHPNPLVLPSGSDTINYDKTNFFVCSNFFNCLFRLICYYGCYQRLVYNYRKSTFQSAKLDFWTSLDYIIYDDGRFALFSLAKIKISYDFCPSTIFKFLLVLFILLFTSSTFGLYRYNCFDNHNCLYDYQILSNQ